MTKAEPVYLPVSWDDAQPLVAQIARSLARRYPPVEREDIEQELLAYLWKRRERILKRGPAWVNFELSRKGAEWCRKQRADNLNRTDQYYYTPEDVAKALDVFFDDEDWNSFTGTTDDKLYSDGSSGGQVIYHDDKLNGISMLLDIRRVWDDLKLGHQQALFYTYAMRLNIDAYAYEAELTYEAARSQLRRAEASLLAALNANNGERDMEHQGPGARTAISNERAHWITQNGISGGLDLVGY